MKAAEVKTELVWDWMRPETGSIQVDASLEEAVSRMKKLDVHHLLVMDGKVFKGILDSRDCAGQWDPKKPVRQIMRADVPLIDENTPISTVVEHLVSRGLTAIPLKRGQELNAVITSTDLLRLLEAQLSHQGAFSHMIEKGTDFLTRPVVQSLARLLEGAGI